MKLLIDENLSFQLVNAVADLYPLSAHVRDVGLLGAPDEIVWLYAAQHDFLLTSKDANFYQRSMVFGAPPKIIWLRVGNAPTAAIAKLLRDGYSTVLQFRQDPDASFLPLSLS